MRLRDGHSTRLTFPLIPSINLWTKGVTPPGYSGGGANDTTVMENLAMRTYQPKKLITVTNAEMTIQYDPDIYVTLATNINVNQPCAVIFSDNATLTFFGWVDEFRPEEAREGTPPEARLTVIPSNQNEDGFEVLPEFEAGA